MSSSDDSASSSSDSEDRYHHQQHGLTDTMNVFLNSPGFELLKKHGFLNWGTEEKFLEDFNSGSSASFDTAIEYAEKMRSVDHLDSDDSLSSDSSSSDDDDDNSNDKSSSRKLSKQKKKKKKRKGKKSSESKKANSSGDWQILNGVITDADGKRLIISDTETDATRKKFLKVLNKATLRQRKPLCAKTSDELMKEHLLGISDETREYANLWAKKWGSQDAEFITEFKQPEYLRGGKENIKNKSSVIYRFPLEFHMQGLVEGLKFSGLAGEIFDENSSKSALARAKKFNSLTLKTSSYEILANRFLAAQSLSAFDGFGKLLQFMQQSFPEDIESSNKKLWDVYGQLRLSLLHVGKTHSKILASISELEKIQDKNLRLSSERQKMQELHNLIWYWPLFADPTTDTSTSQPPKFFNRSRPLEVNKWQNACKSDICGSQKLQRSSKQPTHPKSPSKGQPSRKRKRKKKSKAPKGQFKCRLCGKNHQHGQKCPKRKKLPPKGGDDPKGPSSQ